MRATRWSVRAAVVAALFALFVAVDVWRIPVQVSDSLGEILDAQQFASVGAAFDASLGSAAYLRPLRIAQIKALYDLSGGERVTLVYRGFHVLLVLALVGLFTRALRVQTADDFAAALFGLTVLIGLHTFNGFVREAFPINHFLEIAVLCVLALNLARSRGGWWVDVLAAVTLAWAALTLESGVLVWVVVVGAWLVGWRGVSWRGVALTTLVLAGYFVLRFAMLDTGVPSLSERSAGFLLARLEPAELERRFGDRPWVFYAYNVGASLLSVLAAEPREGVFVGVASWLDGHVPPRTWIGIFTSAGTTLVILGVALRRLFAARDEAGRDALRWTALATLVLGANAVLSFAYTKDDIMAVSGVFFAGAAFAAVRATLSAAPAMRAWLRVTATVVLLALAGGWAVRSAGLHHVMRRTAFRVANDWASVEPMLRREGRLPDRPAARRLINRLRRDAVQAPVGNSQMLPEWNNQWFGD